MIGYRGLVLVLALWIVAASAGCQEALGVTATPLPASPLRAPAQAAVFYVRPDGGDATQCTGLADAPYSGSGTGQPCAWEHPFHALPPGGTPRIQGGDTLLIGAGSYPMGFGAPGLEACEADSAFDCHMPPLPGGPDAAHPTRILGAGWDAGCPHPPELWGTERSWFILNLAGSSHVEIGCLEITDHSGCVEFHTGGLACERDAPPYGPWASDGIYAVDSTDVDLHHLNIHGLATAGVRAGRLADWRVVDVRIAGNGWVGWEGDLGEDSANAGTLLFRRLIVEWNGCGETYPGGAPAGCWGQTAGGYGDGIGTGETGGRWIFEDSAFRHNTSDGLDLLYVRRPGSRIEIRRTLSEGNAGDQFKTTGPAIMENVIAVSNCGFFEGQPFTHHVDNCRAGGSALALTLHAGDAISVVNSTLTGQGDCLIIAECAEGQTCRGEELILLRNTIFLGHPEFSDPNDTTCLIWADGLPGDPFELDHLIMADVKGMPDPCPPQSLCGVSPGLVSETIDGFDAHLMSNSPAIDAGTPAGAPVDDFAGRLRDGQPDIGAYEWRELSVQRFLPRVRR